MSPESKTMANTPIVGIGASAGGLAALEMLFEQLPIDTGAAFVVIQHLSPDYQSHMPELLGRRTKMDALQLEQEVEPKPNTVYLLPPGKHVVYEEQRLHLINRDETTELSLPIDRFFSSLAEQEERRIATVILSGTGSDGSSGIQEVCREGGLVLCQDEDSAQFNSMPLNAMKTECVHVVAPVPELAEALVSFLGGASVEQVVSESAPTIGRGDLDPVCQLLVSYSGVDFANYKSGTFTRRLSRRMLRRDVSDIDDYVKILRENPEELSQLHDDLLIGVTRFFRDEDGYDRLTTRVLRPAARTKSAGDEYRVWVAGCATGQEAYSVAMLVHDERKKSGIDYRIKIFATDVHPEAIRFAQRATYPKESLREIPAKLREQYVTQKADSFEINKEIRDSIVFARHDLTQDAPFTNLDLVTCRNMLIYLLDEAQDRVLTAFTHALRARGALWLGPSESPGDSEQQYAALDKQWRIFQKERDTRLPLDLKIRSRPYATPRISMRPRTSRAPSPGLVLTYDKMMELYAPPSILVNDGLQPVQVFGDLSEYTSVPGGRLSGTVEDILNPVFRVPVAIALQRLRMNSSSEETERASANGTAVTIKVKSFQHGTVGETYLLITFNKESSQTAEPPVPAEPSSKSLSEPPNRSPLAPQSSSLLSGDSIELREEHIRLLEMDLEFTRENLQATIEELETTNEELQSSNEELTSSNEELQSTNEELHSVNEELHTTYAESDRRVILLSELTADLENVLRASDLGIVLVDSEMQIRRITPTAVDMLALRTNNPVGESLINYAKRFEDVDLISLIGEVRESDQPIQCETRDRHGDAILLRVAPYKDRQGAVLTFTNISGVKETADNLRKLTSIVSDSTDAIIGVELDGTVTSWNRGARCHFGDLWEDEGTYHLADVLPAELDGAAQQQLRALRRNGRTDAAEVSFEWNGSEVTFLLRVTPVLDDDDKLTAAAITIYDVTKLRVAEKELRLRTRAIDASSNGIIIVDALADDMPIVYCNRGFEQITGFSSEETLHRNCRFLQGRDTDKDTIDKIRAAIRNRATCRVTVLNYRRDGSPFYNDLIITPVTNADGLVTHFVGIQNDVTESMQSSLKLKQSEEEYRGTFENAAIGIAHVSLDGHWLRVNEKLCEIVGYTRDELMQKTFQDITHEADIDKDLIQFAKLRRGEIPGYAMEKRYVHKNGHCVWIRLTVSMRHEFDGTPPCAISLVEDITQRKETERQLTETRNIISEVIENIEDAFISFDHQGIVRVANAAAVRMAAVKEHSELIGKPYEVLFADDPTSPLLSLLDRVRRSQRGESKEYFATHLNRWYDAKSFPINGGAALYMSDVTARKDTEVHLEQARLAAEDASRAKTAFLTNMSHEIRSPMSAILGFTDIALRDLRDGKKVEETHLETVIRNGRFLLRIINDILDLSKVEAGKLQVRRSLFRLVPMLADLMDLMRHRSKANDVPLSIEFETKVPAQLHSDRSRVEQILVNLIGNAIKFTPQGSVRLVVSCQDSLIFFRVIDTGIGISARKIKSLFQMFSQVHDNEKLVGVEGTGLGLVISKRLANLLDGEIDVASVEGRGSTFTLQLPIGDIPQIEMITPKTEDLVPERTNSGMITTVRGRILVADDARDIRHVTKHFLSRAGAEVVEAVNGAEAVAAVREAEAIGRPFACILMDMQMPEMGGREATRAIRDQGLTMPIIALTAGATADEIQEALNSGCTQFISKPVNSPKLIETVAKLTGSYAGGDRVN
ncbi:PAS domain S-box protein [Stieleria varia]|uniref:Autoinducer 2 sensor kinase/phosphatase LuxQ n=1 Tax=Stieleria varia TaxID=2528005 RepID=A0A5C6AU70_9BACT|nr:PAS domain S-box protein [Stieleria varia]TWU02596.1 Autoinducer 2 sensor kinase/phosphatase LuxQ [Stieleria varia]